MSTYDLFHDAGHGRLKHALELMPNLAHYLATTKVASDANGSALPDTAFADPVRRLWPIHTPKMAAISMAYVKAAELEGSITPEPVATALKMAAEAYALDNALFEVAIPVEKTAAPTDYLFPEERLYPIRTADEVKTAEARLHEERTKLLPATRVAAYSRLYEKAAELGLNTSPTTLRYAGMTETNVPKLVDMIRARAGAVKEASQQGVYERFADAVKKAKGGLRERDNQIKVAQLLSNLDEQSGLVGLYDRGIPDPMETVFNTEKTAQPGIDLGGTNVPMTKLMSLDPSFYGDVLGDDFLPDLTTGAHLDQAKMAEVLPTLPRDMKLALARALKNA